MHSNMDSVSVIEPHALGCACGKYQCQTIECRHIISLHCARITSWRPLGYQSNLLWVGNNIFVGRCYIAVEVCTAVGEAGAAQQHSPYKKHSIWRAVLHGEEQDCPCSFAA